MSSPDSIAKAAQLDTPLDKGSIQYAKEQIIQDLFRRFQGTNPEMESALQAAFEKKYGRKMLDQSGGRDVRAMFLEGEAGHGKTTCHELACKEFAELLGMNFVSRPTVRMLRSGQVGKSDFVYSVVSIAGATSKHEVGGLMAKIKVGDQEFMDHLPDVHLAAAMMGGFGYVLFDDFTAAAPQTQSATLDLLLTGVSNALSFNMEELAASTSKFGPSGLEIEYDGERAEAIRKLAPNFNGAGTVHIGAAANRGKRDGNNSVFPISLALATRFRRMDVQDTPGDWINRAYERHRDEVGEGFYTSFMRQHSELFSIIGSPIDGIVTQIPSPRSHDACMDSVRFAVHMHGGFAHLGADAAAREAFLDDVKKRAGQTIGHKVEFKGPGGVQLFEPSEKLRSFYSEMLLGAYPKAEQIIRDGDIDTDFLREKINNGIDGQGKTFEYQFAAILGNLAATSVASTINASGLKKEELTMQFENLDSDLSRDLRLAMSRYSYGLCMISKSMLTFSINKFQNRLASLAPVVFEGSTNYKTMIDNGVKPLVYGLVRDNEKFPKEAEELKESFVDAVCSIGINDSWLGDDPTIKSGLKKRRKALDAVKKAGAMEAHA